MFTTPFFIVSLLKMTKNKDFNPMPEASGCNLLCLKLSKLDTDFVGAILVLTNTSNWISNQESIGQHHLSLSNRYQGSFPRLLHKSWIICNRHQSSLAQQYFQWGSSIFKEIMNSNKTPCFCRLIDIHYFMTVSHRNCIR